MDDMYYNLLFGMSKEEMVKETNKTFKLDWKEKAALDVFMFAREGGLDAQHVSWFLFDGDNYKECEKFVNGNCDNTLNYPNVVVQGKPVEVKEGNVIMKYKDEYRIL